MKSIEEITKINQKALEEYNLREIEDTLQLVKEFFVTGKVDSLALDDSCDRRAFVRRFRRFLRKNY